LQISPAINIAILILDWRLTFLTVKRRYSKRYGKGHRGRIKTGKIEVAKNAIREVWNRA